MFAVSDLAADLKVVKSLFPIEDVDVAVTTATTAVGLSLPEDARVDEEMTASVFDLDETLAWRLYLLVWMPLARLDIMSHSKSHFLLFFGFRFPFGGQVACNADTCSAHGNNSHEGETQPKCRFSKPAYSVSFIFSC